MNNYQANQKKLDEIFEAFNEELDRKPRLSEFFSLILWSIRNDVTELFDENAEGIKMKTKSGVVRIQYNETMDHLGDLNDNCFTASAEAIARLSKEMNQGKGSKVKVLNLLESIVQILKTNPTGYFEDFNQKDIEKIDVLISKQKKIRPKKGDVIAIPLSANLFAACIFITKTSFGSALGIFNKKYHRIIPNELKDAPVLNFPIFTTDSSIETGDWKILFNDPGLLAHFPENPERYHSPLLTEQAKPYGLAETSDGQLRKLSRQESESIGISEAGFEQVLTPEEVDNYLAKKITNDAVS